LPGCGYATEFREKFKKYVVEVAADGTKQWRIQELNKGGPREKV